MSRPALQAAYIAIENRLTAGAEPWGRKIRISVVKSGTTYPYVVQFWAGGGSANRIKQRDAELRIAVKAVSDKMADVMICAERITELLDDHGYQDNADDYLSGGTSWTILSITEEDAFFLAEPVSNTITVYHVGAFYRLFMQHT